MRWLITLLSWLLLPSLACADFNYDTASRSVVTVFCESSKSLGGGVVLSNNNIISMQHVIAPCRQVIIGYFDNTYALGAVADIDEARDLVIIKPDHLTDFAAPAQLNIDAPRIGDKLHVISHPNGMSWSYTPASLAYPHERIITIEGHKFSLLIVNATAFAGSSGGALFDDNGRVIGFAKGVLSGTSISYFVPSSAVCKHLINCKTR